MSGFAYLNVCICVPWLAQVRAKEAKANREEAEGHRRAAERLSDRAAVRALCWPPFPRARLGFICVCVWGGGRGGRRRSMRGSPLRSA